MKASILFVSLFFILAACAPNASSVNTISSLVTQQVTAVDATLSPGSQPTLDPPTSPATTKIPLAPVQPAPRQTSNPLVTPRTEPTQPIPQATQNRAPTTGPDSWKDLPVIPEISPKVQKIYQRGVKLGNNPQAFSKIGDCGSTPAWFLGDFDRGPRFYQLGEFENLTTVIQAFQGSFSRTSLAAKSGFNASSIFSPLWSNLKLCLANEAPLACEYRIQKPTFAFIMLGSNDVYHPEEFEPQMRKIIEYSLDQGIIPILSTKADNLEGDGRINATIARLAIEYDVPLWNYWRALQDLPDQGLQEDKVHITWGANRFNDPLSMTRGWPVRNLTALQILDALWQAVTAANPAT